MIETILQLFCVPKTWTRTEKIFTYIQLAITVGGFAWQWFYPPTSLMVYYQGVLCGVGLMMGIARWYPVTVRPVPLPWELKTHLYQTESAPGIVVEGRDDEEPGA